MATSYINDPEHWQQRATEIRAIAAEMTDPEIKVIMLRLAEDYQELAARAAKRAGGEQRSR